MVALRVPLMRSGDGGCTEITNFLG